MRFIFYISEGHRRNEDKAGEKWATLGFVVNLKEKISQDLAVKNIILPDSTFRENLFITKTNK